MNVRLTPRATAPLAMGALLVVYAVTLARGVTHWDAGEFLAAIHAFGIPHPPGTPAFVLAARAWSVIASPVLGFTMAVNAFSAMCTAAAFGLLASLFVRWTRDPLAALAGALCAGLMSTVWLNATETEVYSASLLLGVGLLWIAQRAVDTGNWRWMILLAYGAGVGWALHLTALLVVPAVCAILIHTPIHFRDVLSRRSLGVSILAALFALFGASIVIVMLIRAHHDPSINQANPITWPALWDAIQRRQYEVAPMWPRRAPWWLQIGNVFEYADWQIALGVHRDPNPSWGRTVFTALFGLSGLYGCIRHRQLNRASWRVMMILLVTTTLGVVAYLNLHAGPSFGYGILPDDAIREARERDYFFTLGFICWGLWAGAGLVFAARVTRRIKWIRNTRTLRRQWLPASAVAAAALPLGLNWTAIRHARHEEQRVAERDAAEILSVLPANAVLLAEGDNDTYPIWYLQEVQGIRPDVTVITVPLLPPSWYRLELSRRYALLDSTMTGEWQGERETLKNIRAHARRQRRPVLESPYPLMGESVADTI